MSDFANRLRSEIRYQGLVRKELAVKATIQKRALDNYLDTQASMPPADIAVKIARALDCSVEYLVTGERNKNDEMAKYKPFRKILDDLLILPEDIRSSFEVMVHAAAQAELDKQKKTISTG